MKRVRADSHESVLSQLFSEPTLRSDKRNRCVPILDVLSLPDCADVLLVMPFLRFWDDPRLQTIGEVVEFFRQMLEVRTMYYRGTMLIRAIGPTIHS